MAEEALDPTYIRIFSDSSGIEGMIGAAAVLYHLTNGNQITKHTLRYCLGPETKHTKYEGEVIGEILAQHLLLNETCGFGRHASMYIDNQASIMATQSISPAPGHHLLDILHDKVACTRKKHRNIRITAHWIPSHKEVEGNEEADRQAKRAVKGDADSPLHRLPNKMHTPLPNSKSAIQQVMIKTLKAEAATTLQKSPQWRKLHRVDPTMPSNRYRKLVDHLPRKHAMLLIQLRTGHALLNKPLFSSPVLPTSATVATYSTNSIEAHDPSPHFSPTPKRSDFSSSTSLRQDGSNHPWATWRSQTTLPPPQRAVTEQT
jgi:hypothetical protein